MARDSKYFGLCETCEHDDACTLRRSSQLKIIQCEEFSIQPTKTPTHEARFETQIYEARDNASMGLCANCLHSVTCGFPNARQDVLQCEEYMLDEAGVVPTLKRERSRSAA